VSLAVLRLPFFQRWENTYSRRLLNLHKDLLLGDRMALFEKLLGTYWNCVLWHMFFFVSA